MGRCEKCSLSEGESKLAREAYLDLMNVPEKYRGTTSDYRGFDAVCEDHVDHRIKIPKYLVVFLSRSEIYNHFNQCHERNNELSKIIHDKY